MREKKIIVVANHKGGTGKTTISILLAIGLHYKGYKVAHIDLDADQGSASNFWEIRKHLIDKHHEINSIDHDAIHFSKENDKHAASREDNTNLLNILDKYKDKEIIILDTAGSDNYFTTHSMNICNLIITPITDSYLDLSSLINNQNDYKYGPFAKFVFDAKITQMRKGNIFKWIVVRNKIPLTPGYRQDLSTIEKTAKTLQFHLYSQLFDRETYRKTFEHGLTMFDIPHLDNPTSSGIYINSTAYKELDDFVTYVQNTLYNK